MNPVKWLDVSSWPIRYKMLAGLSLAIGLPLLLIFIVAMRTSTSLLIDNYRTNLEYASRAGATSIVSNLDAVLNETLNASLDQRLAGQVAVYARTVTDTTALVSPALRNNTVNVLNGQLERHPRFQAIRLLTADGQLLVAAGDTELLPGLTEIAQDEHPAYRQIVRAEITPGAPLLLEPYADPASGALVLETATLVVSQDTLLGYLVFTLNTGRLLDEALTVGTDSAESSQYLYLLDEDGWLLTPLQGIQPQARQVMLRSPGDQNPDEAEASYFQDWGDGPVEVTGHHATVQPYGWTVVAEVALQDVTGPITRTLLFRLLPIVGLVVLLSIPMLVVINSQINLVTRLTQAAEQVALGNLQTEIRPSRRPDEIGQLQRAIATMTDNVRQSITILEERVQARTRDLETTSAIAREAARQEAVGDLLNNTVNLIVQNFPAVYHAQVFLIDPHNEYAELVASTGEAGRQLLAAGHRLAVGSVSVIGRVTELGETVIARDTSTSRVHRRNEFLQETRAEMALPLIYGDRVLGALDVQSKLAHAFTPEDQQVFNTLATELAIIINSAQQTARLQARLAELETQSRALTRADWNQLLSANRRRGYLEARVGEASEAGWSEWQEQAAAQKQVVVSPPGPDNTAFLAVPVFSREDEVLGVIEWRVERSRINDQALRMAEQLARRLSNSMETVRLLERSQLLAERERLVNEISGKLTTEPSVAYILETAVNELSGILQTSRVNIQLKPSSAAVPAGGPSENK